MVVASSLNRTRIFTVVHPLNPRKIWRAISMAGSTSISDYLGEASVEGSVVGDDDGHRERE